MGVELASIFVICSAGNVIEIAMNFIALAVVADFDDIVFASMKNECFSILLESDFTQEALKISHTTSIKCDKADLSEDMKDDEGNFRPLRIQFGARTPCNKCLYVTYKWLRMVYVSTFFYFLPFAVIIVSTILPQINRSGLPECDNTLSGSRLQ